jgi:protein gp37
MGEKTGIDWCDHTFNGWIGCMKVSPGCLNCYAETMMDKRYHRVQWGQMKTETTEPSVGTRVRTSAANWRQPLKWAKRARELQRLWDAQQPFEVKLHPSERIPRPERPRVFCSSLADVFDNQVPEEWRNDLWRLIRDTPELDWLLLTKRPENIERFLPASWHHWSTAEKGPMDWQNVWLGFTAEDQEHFDRRWPIMRDIPAVVRFCSYEPAIGPLRLRGMGDMAGLGWLICGGESGKGHRPMEPEWERLVRNDCFRFGIPYFFKQLAGKRPIPADFPVVRQFPEVPHG